jgi:sterol desaturase/sphingolipid hydroxylase (fatty acid hydroxylase superfamily)
MQLSKAGYYSDFVVYPIVITTLAVAALAGANSVKGLVWFAALLAGVAIWTLIEYVVHRVALHRVGMFVPMHGLHHSSPLAYVGTPTWLSMTVLCGAVLAPAWWWAGFNVASGLTAGVMGGYLWYGLLHHWIHHRRHAPTGGYIGALRAWHLHHHYSQQGGNYGVTTGFWDHIFGTVIPPGGLKRG